MSLVAIITARMGSSRLPGKSLAPICGIPLIERVIKSVRMGMPYNSRIILATTDLHEDDVLADFGARLCAVYRGHATDVLERIYQAALDAKATRIVRFTGDCPLLDPTMIRSSLGDFGEGGWDYHGLVNNTWRQTTADGLDHECLTMDALTKARNTVQGDDRQNAPTKWIWENCQVLPASKTEWADVHFSVNDLDDLRHCEKLIQTCGESMPARIYSEASRRLRSLVPEAPLATVSEPQKVEGVPGVRLKKDRGSKRLPDALPEVANDAL